MNYLDFKDLDEFKVYLKKLAVEDIGKALDEIEEIVIVNSSVFDTCMIFRAKHERLTEFTKKKNYDEQVEVQLNRLLNNVFALINDLKYRKLKQDVSKHFYKNQKIKEEQLSFEMTIDKIERLLYQNINYFFDFLYSKLESKKTNELILLKSQRDRLEEEVRLGLMTKKDREDNWDELFKRLLSFVDNLNESDFKKEIFKN